MVNIIKRDLNNPHAELSLNTADYAFDTARYVGSFNYKIAREYSEPLM